MKTCKINAFDKNKRISTQDLLQLIQEEIDKGKTDFEINACGQHDIAGALWAKNKNKKLNFTIRNPGQRVGAMAMKNTFITVIGSASADVGWLNSGAEIIVKGDAGDTASHCAASGKIFIAGRTGARSGALMKHDPKFKQPEFWVLKNTGSFSFEFMGGGIGVVCGFECGDLPSVLGSRSCVGMVGGVIYVRGKIEDLASCVEVVSLNKEDKKFLKEGLKEFLEKIDKEELYSKLTKFNEWKKIIPASKEKKVKKISVAEFKKNHWFKEGLFGDLVEDNGEIFYLGQSGCARLRKPFWNKKLCIGCNLCLNNCPNQAIEKQNNNYISKDTLCTGCGICEAVCPKSAWNTEDIF